MGRALLTPKVTVTVADPDLVESCCEVAVMVKVPADELLNSPVIGLMVPPLEDHVTLGLKLPVPTTVAAQVDACPVCTVAGLQVALTDVTAPAAATVMVVVPFLVESCVDVAVIVTWVLKGTVAAVKTPVAAFIVPPPLAVQNTVELKLPVPETEAVH
jgi:hypothetical protein